MKIPIKMGKFQAHRHAFSLPFITTPSSSLQPTNQQTQQQQQQRKQNLKLFAVLASHMGSGDDGGVNKNKCNNNVNELPVSYQNVIVMRHGDRIDNFDVMWASKAVRKWDPELVEDGKVRAFNTGRKLRANLGFPIHRVFVSPFLRCLQTAAEVVSALCADVDSDDQFLSFTKSADGLKIDSSKIKVSIEYGLCEMLNTAAIRPHMAPKDGDFGFETSKCESVLPAGTVDCNVQPVYTELPKWQETVEDARSRYVQIMKALAEKYPSENLLLVTHGEGVGSVFSALMDGAIVHEVEYCAYLHARRPIFSGENQSVGFEVVGQNGLVSARAENFV